MTELLAQGRWAIDHARELEIPTLIMHGGDDDMIDQSACEHLAIRIGDSAHYVNLPGMRHALFHDADRQVVLEKMVGLAKRRWRRRRVANGGRRNGTSRR